MTKARVLIVDDEPDIVDTLSMVLERSGHETATAENGAVALARLRDGFAASIILLDLMMPVMDGSAFLAEQGRDPALSTIPVVTFSGDYTRLASTRGPTVVDTLRKPLELGRLLEAITTHARTN